MITNPKYIADASFSVFNGSDMVSRMNMTVDLRVDLEKPSVLFTVKVKYSKTTYTEINRGRIDPCEVQKGIVSNFFRRTIAKAIEESSNYQFTCPQKKGFLYFVNAKVYEVKEMFPLLARAYAGTSDLFILTIMFNNKIRKQQRMVLENVITASIHGISIL